VRAAAQRDQILALLQERGRAGAKNVELNLIGFRYGARIWELRRAGHQIITINEGDGVFRFVLEAEPAGAQSETVEAFDQRPDEQPEQPPVQAELFTA